jgi:hypothetical protein
MTAPLFSLADSRSPENSASDKLPSTAKAGAFKLCSTKWWVHQYETRCGSTPSIRSPPGAAVCPQSGR